MMNQQQKHERAKEDAKTSNDFARFGAQSAILINGAAASAVLAFIGSLARNSVLESKVLPLITYSISGYTVGVSLAATSFLVMSRSVESFMMEWSGESGAGRRGTKLWTIALILVALALMCFLGTSIYLSVQIAHLHL